jgi:hypothetical protein
MQKMQITSKAKPEDSQKCEPFTASFDQNSNYVMNPAFNFEGSPLRFDVVMPD